VSGISNVTTAHIITSLTTLDAKRLSIMKNEQTLISLDDAKKLASSLRGSYIIGKALLIASRVLESGDVTEREPSDAADCRDIAQLFLTITADVDRYEGRVIGEKAKVAKQWKREGFSKCSPCGGLGWTARRVARRDRTEGDA
tara:strand:- start:906 stop:1334 length:429 start_codon:yes stop_codon:yes gene_type:complete